MKSLLAVLAPLLICQLAMPQAFAAPEARVCKNDPALAGACFEVHGRMMSANGYPNMRIWRTGTKRILGVLYSSDDPHGNLAPSNVTGWQDNGGWLGIYLYGDYLVCPLSKQKPGDMQAVCLEAARNLIGIDPETRAVIPPKRP